MSASRQSRGGAPSGPRRDSRLARHAHAGFSLLEVLVAFVIVGLVVTALFRLYGGAMNNMSAADDWTRALLVAQSRLAIASAAQPLRETTEAGTEDAGHIEWRASVVPWVPPDVNADLEQASQTMPTRLYRISVDVTFPGIGDKPRSLSLSTIAIGARSPT